MPNVIHKNILPRILILFLLVSIICLGHAPKCAGKVEAKPQPKIELTNPKINYTQISAEAEQEAIGHYRMVQTLQARGEDVGLTYVMGSDPVIDQGMIECRTQATILRKIEASLK